MNQTKLESLIESIVNVIIGYGVALLSQLIVFPMFNIHIPFSSNIWIGLWFTLISLVRSYTIRRWFNTGLHRVIKSIAITLTTYTKVPK